jgi:tetratricopeptide (TPR) repeat protein/MinD-like ATPase involved in chromosome partitioning or flagellar assembly
MAMQQKIFSFYSYKGGAGRSQLLVNLAAYLCHHEHKKLLLIDWDLEAPGLDMFFQFDRTQIKDGIVELFEKYVRMVRSETALEVEQLPYWDDSYRCNLTTSGQGGCIDFIPAANYQDPEYPHRINSFDWFEFYSDLDGKYFIEFLKEKLLASPYDFIFIDTRTGLSEYLGICNIQLPDTNVIVVAPSEQNFSGAQNIIQKILDSPYTKEHRPKPIILPVFSRVDTQHGEKYSEWCEKFLTHFKTVLDQTIFYTNHLLGASERFIENATINYDVDLAYGETVRFKNVNRRIQPGSIEQKFTYIWKYLVVDTKSYLNLPKIEKPISSQLTLPPNKPLCLMGREEELSVLSAHFSNPPNTTLILSGEAGIGKTSLAAAYYYSEASKYTHVGWVNCQRGPSSVHIELDRYFQLNENTPSERRSWELSDLKSPCLLVLDDVHPQAIKEGFLDEFRLLENFHVLVTTRAQALVDINEYTIHTLSKTAALQLFEHHYRQLVSEELDLFDRIMVEVGYNTVVIELLAKNLNVLNRFKRGAYSLKQLLSDLQEKGLFGIQTQRVQLAYPIPVLREVHLAGVVQGMYDFYTVSRQQEDLLSTFAVLPSEVIPIQMIKRLFRFTPNLLAVENHFWGDKLLAFENHLLQDELYEPYLTKLRNAGWLYFDEIQNGFKMNPIIQAVVRNERKGILDKDCEFLILSLSDFLDRDSLQQDKYNDSIVFARYAASVVQYFQTPDLPIIRLNNNIGAFHLSLGNLDNALKFYEDSNHLYKLLDATQSKDKVEEDYQFALLHQKLGDIYTLFGDWDKTVRVYEAILSNRIFFSRSNKVVLLKATLSEKLGDAHTSFGNLDKALKYYNNALNLMDEELRDLRDLHIKNRCGIILFKLGETHDLLGNSMDTHQCFKRCKQLFKELSFIDFDRFYNPKYDWAIMSEKIGHTHTLSSDFNNAFKVYERCLQLFKELCFDYPANVDYQKGLADTYQFMGKTYVSLYDLDRALIFFKESFNLNQKLYDISPANVRFKNGLAVSFQLLGSIYFSLGNFNLALEFSEAALKLSKELYNNHPANVEFKYNLAISHFKLGEIDVTRDKRDMALQCYQASKQLKVELCASCPSNVKFKNELACVYYQLGDFYKEQDKQQAFSYLKKAANLWQELKQDTPIDVEQSELARKKYHQNLQKVQEDLTALEISQTSNPFKKIFLWLMNVGVEPRF